jgi:hypothetical protein
MRAEECKDRLLADAAPSAGDQLARLSPPNAPNWRI